MTIIRGIRIDSIQATPDATIYFPFHTKRGRYATGSGPAVLDPDGGSWLGRRVIELLDGTFLFDNIWGDTVTVRTQAAVGDSWMFYEDTSDVYYIAEVISTSEQLIYGVPDSVKEIGITAYRHSTSAVATDPANGLILSLSKNFGFIQVFDMYLFPHRCVHPYPGSTAARDTMDYFFQKCGGQQFRQMGLYQPNWEEIYDFHVGDVFEYMEYCTEGAFAGACEKYLLDTIVSRDETATKITYTLHEGVGKTIFQFPAPVYTYSFSIKTKVIMKGYADMVDTNIMPEETGATVVTYYNPNDTSLCHLGSRYSREDGILFNEFEPCGSSVSYKMGVGMISRSVCRDPSPGPSSHERIRLVYCVRNGIACGTLVPVFAGLVAANMSGISVYPNPAGDVLNLSFTRAANYSCSLVSVTGQQVIDAHFSGSNFVVNIASIAQGVYILTIYDDDGNKYIQRLAVMH